MRNRAKGLGQGSEENEHLKSHLRRIPQGTKVKRVRSRSPERVNCNEWC